MIGALVRNLNLTGFQNLSGLNYIPKNVSIGRLMFFSS